MKHLFLITILTLFFAANVLSQSISGEVKDQMGAFVPGATVELRNKVGNFRIETTVDDRGSYKFERLSPSTYILKVKAEGFSQRTETVTLRDDLKLNFTLSVGNVAAEVTVTGTKTQVASLDSTVPVTVIGRDQIERKSANTIGDVFRDLPGVSTNSEGAFQVRPRIRGLESNRILVLVDGERLNNARTSTAQSGIETGLVDIAQIETVEIVRGSGSVLYGTDALAGTINIISRGTQRNTTDDFRFGASFSGLYSSNENGRRGSVSVNGSNKNFAFRVSQSLDRFENYFTGDADGLTFSPRAGFVGDREVGNSQSHSGNTFVSTRFFFDEENDLRLGYERRRAANVGSPLLTLGFGFNAYFPFSKRDKFNGRFETRNVTENLAKLSASFYYQNQERNFVNRLVVPAAPPFFPGLDNLSDTVTDTNSIGFDVQSNWVFSSRNVLTAGFSFFRDENEDRRFQENRIPFPVQSNEVDVPNSDFGSFAAFAQDEFTVNDRLRLVGGFRVERFFSGATTTSNFTLPATISQNDLEDLGILGLDTGISVSETAVTGDFGAVYRLTDSASLTGRIGRSFRVANLFERFFTGAGSLTGFIVGNPTLEPESGINFDTSLRIRTDKFATSFTYFNNYYTDFLSNEPAFNRDGNPIVIPPASPMSPPTDVFQTVNIGRARIQGFEAEFNAPINAFGGFLTPNGNVSYLRGDNLERDEPLNVITPLKTVVGLRWDNVQSNYYAFWNTRIVNGQDRLPTLNEGEILPIGVFATDGKESGFAVSEIGGGYSFERENYTFRFNAGVQNLFNRFYREQFVFAPARGRSFVFGTTIEFNSKK